MILLSTPIILVAAAVILLVVIFMVAYVKAPPSTAYVISGFTKEPRFLIGKGGFQIPVLERKDELSLSQITIDINTKEPVPTRDFIEVNIDAVAIIQVNPKLIVKAAKNYIGKTKDEIGASVVQTLSGCLREAIGTVEFKELNLNRDAFSKTVMKNATADIESLGLEILSCNIERVRDSQGLIESLGADNTWRIKKDAATTKAISEREIRETTAVNEQAARNAEIKTAEEIAQRENDLCIKKAKLKKESDRYQAEADAAYKIQEAEQLKTVNEATVEADIAKTVKEQKLSAERLKVRENELISEINKQADAEKYRTQVDADAEYERQRINAEAELIIQQKQAEAAKVKAEAERFVKEQEAEALKLTANAAAEQIRLEGEARADAIRAAGLAEAEALQKKAEAYESFNQAAILDMVVKVIPEMSKNIAEPIKAISSLNIYGSDASGINQVAGAVPSVMKQTFDVLSSVGVPVDGMLQSKTINAMTDHNIGISGADVDDITKPLNS